MFGVQNKRFLLTADIDFADVLYTGFNPSNGFVSDDKQKFINEVNGNGHTVSNISFTQRNGIDSVFGWVENSVIKNISFENVQYNSQNGAGIASRLRGADTEIANVSLDLHFTVTPSGRGAGVCLYLYAGYLHDILIELHSPDDPAADKVDGIASTCFANGFESNAATLENIAVYSEGGGTVLLNTALEGGTYKPPIDDSVQNYTSVMDVAWFAYNHFDRGVWQLSPTALPVLQKNAPVTEVAS